MNKLILLLLLAFAMQSCFSEKKEKNQGQPTNDTITVIKKPFPNNPKKIEYEIPVLTGTQKRHGLQKRYYSHGSLYSEINYLHNKRVGVAKTYYPTYGKKAPQVWKLQPYINGKLDGMCKRFHKNGKLQAEYLYKKGLKSTVFKEYTNKGKPIKQPELIVKKTKRDGEWVLTMYMSNKSRSVQFLKGNLVEGKFLTANLEKIKPNSKGIAKTFVSTQSGLKHVTITAVMSTRYRNKYIVSKTIKI